MRTVLVSACLLGAPCRYDGEARPSQAVIDFSQEHSVIAVCPEQLGGLSVPRSPSERDTTKLYPRVIGGDGEDRTAAFAQGAAATVKRALEAGCTLAVMKAKSPSCGSDCIYDGTFSRTLVSGAGVATARLREAGIRVIDEHQLESGNTQALLAENAQETPALETERLVLRPLTVDDAPAVFAYSRDAEVGPNAGWMPHASIQDSLDFIQTIACAPHVFGLFEKGNAAAIGSIGLIPDSLRNGNTDCLMLGYALGRERWGKGYMTEAAHAVIRYGFDDLQLKMITCNCYAFNERSCRVIEKCGFTYEGCIRGFEPTPDGRMRDAFSYSLVQRGYSA